MTDAEKKKIMMARKKAKIKEEKERALQSKNIVNNSAEHKSSIKKENADKKVDNIKNEKVKNNSNNSVLKSNETTEKTGKNETRVHKQTDNKVQVKKSSDLNNKNTLKSNASLNKINVNKQVKTNNSNVAKTGNKVNSKSVIETKGKNVQKENKTKKIDKAINEKKSSKTNNKRESEKLKEIEEEQTIITQSEKVEDTVSLKEIRKALENSINENQRHSIIKDNIVNVMIAIAIILYLIIVYMGNKNMLLETLITDLKVFSISFAVMGLIILEVAYKKDNSKIAFSGGEILIFGVVNLCLMYATKIYPLNVLNITTYISIVVAVYYLAKVIILSVKSTKKYKKDNNDIKEIIKK